MDFDPFSETGYWMQLACSYQSPGVGQNMWSLNCPWEDGYSSSCLLELPKALFVSCKIVIQLYLYLRESGIYCKNMWDTWHIYIYIIYIHDIYIYTWHICIYMTYIYTWHIYIYIIAHIICGFYSHPSNCGYIHIKHVDIPIHLRLMIFSWFDSILLMISPWWLVTADSIIFSHFAGVPQKTSTCFSRMIVKYIFTSYTYIYIVHIYIYCTYIYIYFVHIYILYTYIYIIHIYYIYIL